MAKNSAGLVAVRVKNLLDNTRLATICTCWEPDTTRTRGEDVNSQAIVMTFSLFCVYNFLGQG